MAVLPLAHVVLFKTHLISLEIFHQPCTDDLEARICINNRDKDIRVEVIELYVK